MKETSKIEGLRLVQHALLCESIPQYAWNFNERTRTSFSRQKFFLILGQSVEEEKKQAISYLFFFFFLF